jgi:hypothetical protein
MMVVKNKIQIFFFFNKYTFLKEKNIFVYIIEISLKLNFNFSFGKKS